MSRYTDHRDRWENCTACPLHLARTKICLVRGELPCDVLFVGEAPGQSEDFEGQPFVGPAGQLLDEWIEVAKRDSGTNPSIAFTNLVACFPPLNEKKNREPPKEAVAECYPRLEELIGIADPRVIIAVGTVAAKALKKVGVAYAEEVYHPAGILRAGIAQKGLAIQTAIVTLRDVFEDLYSGEVK